MRPPYDAKSILFLKAQISAGLLFLNDNGSNVIDFERFCEVTKDIGGRLFAPEWESYWNYWHRRFEEKSDRKERSKVFHECISDLIAKGFIKSIPSGLTANFHGRISDLLGLYNKKGD